MKRLVALLFFLSSLCALGQSVTGTLLGTVNDPTGVVPGATVTVINQDTNESLVVSTNHEGTYAATNLKPGTYTLQVSAVGYKMTEIKNAKLAQNQYLRNNVLLQPGGNSDVIEVSADLGLTTSDSPSIATVTDSKTLVDSPTDGRTIKNAITTAPGNSGDGSDSNPKIGGSLHWGGTSFQVNGVSYDDRGNGGGSYALVTSLTTQPSIDAIQDVKIESNAAKAEYANAVAVSITTKGGTNKFHGTLFEFNRNTVFAANDYFAKAVGTPRPPLNRNEYGGTIGGPVLKNRVFFFFDYEPFTLRQQRQAFFTVPTDAQRGGQFTTAIRDPYQLTYFANNKIPDNYLNQTFQKVLQFVPHANTSYATSNYKAPRASNLDLTRYSGKLEYRINEKNRLSFDANWAESGLYFQNLNSPPQYGNYSDAGFQTKSGALTYLHIFNANMTNEVRVSYYAMRSTRMGQNITFDGSTLVPGLYPHDIGGIPIFNMTNYTRIGDVGGSRSNPQMTQQYGDTFLWKRGRHTFKTGFDFSLTKLSTNSGSKTTTLGYFNFLNSRYTLNGLGNALMGIPTSALRSTITPPNVIIQNRYGMYAQDDWQVSHNFSLYYGLRYELLTVPTERTGAWANFDFDRGVIVVRSQGGRLPSLTIPSLLAMYPYKLSEDIGWGSNVLVSDKVNFAPRIGFAYRPLNGTNLVLRGGYGIFYNMPAIYQGIYQLGNSNPPFQVTEQFNGGTTPTITLDDPFATSPSVTANPIIYSVDHVLHNTYSQQFNLTVENKMPGNIGLRISYVGNKAIHAPYVNYEMNRPRKLVAPANQNQSNQDFLPYQPFSNIYGMRFIGTGFTNQLQVAGSRTYKSSLSVQANISWTKALDDMPDTGSPQDPYNARGDWGNSDGVRRINFNFTAGWELPFGPGRTFLNRRGGALSYLVGGWRFNTVTRLMSGGPYSITYTDGRTNSYASRAKWNPAGGPPEMVNRTLASWFNTKAFAEPDQYTYGNTARNMMFGPATRLVNANIAKVTKLYENVSLEVRCDAFNLTNTTNFANPGYVLNGNGFGYVSAISQDPRALQFGARLSF